MTAGFMRPPGREMFCPPCAHRSEEHTSELQSRLHLVCRLLLEKKKKLMLAVCNPEAQSSYRQSSSASERLTRVSPILDVLRLEHTCIAQKLHSLSAACAVPRST